MQSLQTDLHECIFDLHKTNMLSSDAQDCPGNSKGGLSDQRCRWEHGLTSMPRLHRLRMNSVNEASASAGLGAESREQPSCVAPHESSRNDLQVWLIEITSLTLSPSTIRLAISRSKTGMSDAPLLPMLNSASCGLLLGCLALLLNCACSSGSYFEGAKWA